LPFAFSAVDDTINGAQEKTFLIDARRKRRCSAGAQCIGPDAGLTGMHERIRALDGTFQFLREGGRTYVRCRLPVGEIP
jgi:hypothetical protein